jgi:hypothetical protein
VEGGGDAASTKAACREGFCKFFQKITPPGATPKVVASGGRRKAFDNFCDALRSHPNEVILLLVDSERSVTTGVWAHLRAKPDRWRRPVGATEEQAHMMVQCMESWFLADKETLKEFYSDGFRVNALPEHANVELVAKDEANSSLKQASKRTQKGEYHKTHHGYRLLEIINPAKVRSASAHAARFFDELERQSQP